MTNGTKYAYILNLQGDVVGIKNIAGTEVVCYTYDAWGKKLSTTGTMAATLGYLNPFRYRSYVYDEETGLYYLRSRYYNPAWGKFINEDCVISQRFLRSNIFCYCSNNPVMRIDTCGNAWEGLVSAITGLIKAVKSAIEALPGIVENYKKSDRKMAYVKETIASVFYLVCIRESVTYNEKTGLLRIPNSTYAAQKFMYMASYPESEFSLIMIGQK